MLMVVVGRAQWHESSAAVGGDSTQWLPRPWRQRSKTLRGRLWWLKRQHYGNDPLSSLNCTTALHGVVSVDCSDHM